MAKKKTDEIKNLQKEYRRLAKQADKQLRSLERLSKKKGFESVTQYSYKRAMKDIKYWTDPKTRSFKAVELPDNLKMLNARMNSLKRFLNAPTSSKEGIEKLYKDRADNLNEKFGTNFTWRDLADVFDKKEENVFYEKHGGKTYLKAVSYMKDHEEELMNSIYEIAMGEQVVRTRNNKVNEIIMEILDKKGIQFTDLYR